MNFVKPLDEERIVQCSSFKLIVTLEENSLKGGAGSAVNEVLTSNNIKTDILSFGFPDQFLPHGDQDNQKLNAGLDKDQIIKNVDVWLGNKPTVNLIIEKDIVSILSFDQLKMIKSTIHYEKPISAPIKAGDKIGSLIINWSTYRQN